MEAFVEAAYNAFRAVELVSRQTPGAMRKSRETAQALHALARLSERLVDIHHDLSRQAASLSEDDTKPSALREISDVLSAHLRDAVRHAYRFGCSADRSADLFHDIATRHQYGTDQR